MIRCAICGKCVNAKYPDDGGKHYHMACTMEAQAEAHGMDLYGGGSYTRNYLEACDTRKMQVQYDKKG
jgi:hypothetical protein